MAYKESLYTVKHKNASETYSSATDSLEAIRDALDAGLSILNANTRACVLAPAQIEIPDSGTIPRTITILLYDSEGEMETPDSAPTITITTSAGAAWSGITGTAMTLVSTGQYKLDFTVASTETPDELKILISVIEASDTRVYGGMITLYNESIGVGTDAATAAGVIGSVHSKVRTAIENQAVPTADVATNVLSRDSIGNKNDAAVTTGTTTKSLMGYTKGILSGTINGTGTVVPTNSSLYDEAVKRQDSFWAVADSGSTTNFTALKMAGFVNDIFNGKFVMTVILNANSAGNAPEKEQRLITDYVSTTGSFTVTAFSAAIEAGDIVLITPIYDTTIFQGPFTSTAATVNTVTCAALADVAGQYVGSMLIPLNREMRGEGRMITAYDGTAVVTVEPDWPFDPDASAAFDFIIMPIAEYWLAVRGKGLDAIFDLVDAIADLSAVNDSITTDGTEQTAYIADSPAGLWTPTMFKIDTRLMAAGDAITLKVYEKSVSGGSYILERTISYADAQSPAYDTLPLHVNRFGLKITIQRTTGTDRAYPIMFAYLG